MLSQVYYLVRSRADGQYLVARPRPANPDGPPEPGYLLMFSEHADALIYLNTHAAEMASQFSVESIPGTQIKSLMQRWGFAGLGLVQDPLLPRVEFLSPA